MRVSVEITGTTPLMMHNERLSDQDDEYTKAIKEYTDKGKNQTETDKQQVSSLEWRGGVYLDGNDEIVIPAANIVKCFKEAGTRTKSGKKITGGVSPVALVFPLEIDGPRHVDELRKSDRYYDRRMVKVGRGRIKRTRPIFAKWKIVPEFEIAESVLNLDAFRGIVELAGTAEGLGDARILGYGRFKAKVTKIK